MEIVPFESWHLDALEPGEFDRGVLDENRRVLIEDLPGKCVTGIHDGRVLGIGGIAITDRIGKAWLILSDEVRQRFPVFLHRGIKNTLRLLFADHDLEYIEITVDPGFMVSRRWVERLGFVKMPPHNHERMRYVRYASS